jgi:hypothetical protein
MSKKIEVHIKKVTSDEPNVSKRSVTYDVYHNGKYHTTFKDIIDAMDHKEKMHKESVDLDETVLNFQQRQKRAQIMRRNKSKIERARELSRRKMAPEANIKKRAYAQARQIIRRRVAGTRGAEYEKLGPSEKMMIDRAVEGKQKIIKKLALRLIPRVKQAEALRLHSFMKGQQLQNLGQPEGNSKESSGSSSVNESLNTLFKEAFPPTDTSNAIGQKVDSPITSSDKKMPPKGKSKNSVIVQHNKFQEELENNTNAAKALLAKAENSNIDFDILGEVYNRGWNSWNEDYKVTQQQYAFARVNSFINQGKTYFNEDSDLQELSVKTLQSFKDKADDRDTMLATNKIRKANKQKEFYTKTGIMTKVGPKIAASNPIRTKARKYTPSLYDHTEISVDSDLQELSKSKLADYLDKSQSGRQLPTPEKFRRSIKMATIAAKKIGKRFPGSGRVSVKVKATNEAREPGKPSITRYKRPDGTTALKSLNKWGKRKDWQDTEGGLKKAREHSKSDLSESITTKLLHKTDTKEIYHYNDHYHGKDHVSYLVHHYDRKGGFGYAATSHRTLSSAARNANVKLSDIKEEVTVQENTSALSWGSDKDYVKVEPGKAIRTANRIRAKMHSNGKVWVKNGQAAVYRDAKGLAGAGDQYYVHKKHLKEEVQHTNENFIDGKGPGKPGDASRHGLKGKSATELRKIRSSETASPRKKQLAHWMLNMHHNEETELDEKRGLWDNIHAKRKRIKSGSGERMRKPGSEGAPTKQNFRDASESIEEGYDVNSKHYKALTDLDLNTKNRDMTTKHDGYGPLNPMDKKGSKAFWEDKAKMWNTTVEAAMEARCGNCAAFNQAPAIMKKMAEGLGPAGEKIQDLSNLGFCELFEFKCAGGRTCNKWLVNGPITEEDTGNGTKLVDKMSKNSKIRKKIEVVDRAPPHTEYTRQTELQRKIIENHTNCGTPDCCGQCDDVVSEKLGNTQNDSSKRLIGTSSLVKAYKKDTPGEGKKLNDAFSNAFETSRDSVEREVEEEVRSADTKGVVVRTAAGKTIVRKQKVNRKIIGSGNLTDGVPDDTV